MERNTKREVKPRHKRRFQQTAGALRHRTRTFQNGMAPMTIRLRPMTTNGCRDASFTLFKQALFVHYIECYYYRQYDPASFDDHQGLAELSSVSVPPDAGSPRFVTFEEARMDRSQINGTSFFPPLGRHGRAADGNP